MNNRGSFIRTRGDTNDIIKISFKSKVIFRKVCYYFLVNSRIESNIMIDEISKEIIELEPYQLLLTIHDAMVVPDSYSEEVKEKIIRAVKKRINLKPKVKSERVN